MDHGVCKVLSFNSVLGYSTLSVFRLWNHDEVVDCFVSEAFRNLGDSCYWLRKDERMRWRQGSPPFYMWGHNLLVENYSLKLGSSYKMVMFHRSL